MDTARPSKTLRLVAGLLGWLQTAWSICGIVLLLLLALNALVGWSRSRFAPEQLRADGGDWSAAAARFDFDDVPLFAEFADEFQDSLRGLDNAGPFQFHWEPFSYWRSRPFEGKFHHVDANGLRVTWQPPSQSPPAANPKQRQQRIFLFGGSTMWGHGARDDHTIASELAKKLAADGVSADVVNFSQLGYVSTQEIILLQRELQRGNVPDLVVFYDGVNDVGVATQRTIAGQSANESHREDEFNIVYNTTLRRSAWGLVHGTPLAKTVRELRGDTKRQIAAHWQRASLDRVAIEVLNVYQANMRIAVTLGNEFGFDTLFYWQPTVFEKQQCSAMENDIRNEQPTTGEFYRTVNRGIRAIQEQRPPQFAALANSLDFVDLSGAFNQPDWGERHVFWDFCHLTEAGNAHIAGQMLPLVRERLARRRP